MNVVKFSFITVGAFAIAYTLGMQCSAEPSNAIQKPIYPTHEQERVTLEDWSIPFKSLVPKNKPATTFITAQGEIYCVDQRPTASLFLTRPNESNYVAVLQVDHGCPAILNPDGFEYGPIPKLKDLTVLQADQLWGKAVNSDSSNLEKIYRLAAADKSDYFLDTVFDETKLLKYRVRSHHVRGDAAWFSVN